MRLISIPLLCFPQLAAVATPARSQRHAYHSYRCLTRLGLSHTENTSRSYDLQLVREGCCLYVTTLRDYMRYAVAVVRRNGSSKERWIVQWKEWQWEYIHGVERQHPVTTSTMYSGPRPVVRVAFRGF